MQVEEIFNLYMMDTIQSTSKGRYLICTDDLISDFDFSRALFIDGAPFDFEYDYHELFGFVED